MKAIRKDEFLKLNKVITSALPDLEKLEMLDTQHLQNPADTLKTVRDAVALYEVAYYQLRNFGTQCGEFSIGEEEIHMFDTLMDDISTGYPRVLTLYNRLQNKYVEKKSFHALCEKASWDLVEVVCGECGSPMTISAGLEQLSVYYLCEKDGCNNRMNTQLFERIFGKIVDMMAKHPDTDLTGLKWEYKTSYQYYKFEVAKFKPNKVTVSVRNIYRNGM